MTAEQALKPLSADEFYELPDPPEGGKMEFVCGTVVTHVPPGGEHGLIAGKIDRALGNFADENRLGAVGPETGFRLFEVPDTVRGPDVYFVRADRLIEGRMPRSYYPGPPDLAVEVVSPDDRDAEVHQKLREYLDGGTPHVWLVRPDSKTVTVHTPGGLARTFAGEDVLRSADAGFIVHGLELPVSWIAA